MFSSERSDTCSIADVERGKILCLDVPEDYSTERKYVFTVVKLLLYRHALRRYSLPDYQRYALNQLVYCGDEFSTAITASFDGTSDYNVVDKLRDCVYGYVLHSVANIKDASGVTGRLNFDLAVVDLAFGVELSGRLNMLRSWRERGDSFPILTMSAHDYDGLSIEALSAGADDYVRKPFRFAEMIARIERQLARGRDETSRFPKLDGVQLPPAAFEFAGAVIHPDLRASLPNGSAVQLRAEEVGILQEFARHSGSLVLRNALIHAVWRADENSLP